MPAQRHRRAGAEARQQQLARRKAGIAAAGRDRLIGSEVVVAGHDLLHVLVFVDHGDVGHVQLLWR